MSVHIPAFRTHSARAALLGIGWAVAVGSALAAGGILLLEHSGDLLSAPEAVAAGRVSSGAAARDLLVACPPERSDLPKASTSTNAARPGPDEASGSHDELQRSNPVPEQRNEFGDYPLLPLA